MKQVFFSFWVLFLLGSIIFGVMSSAQSVPCQNEERYSLSAWRVHDGRRPLPPVVTPPSSINMEQPATPPSDAVILFDGNDMSSWRTMDGSPAKWIIKDGVMESVRGAGYVRTLQGFGDCQLHVEFATPTPAQGTSQGRGNSGVFLMGIYEIQVLDSYENITYADGQCSAVYGQYPPQVNACRQPGEWQTYDIIFKAPRFDGGGELITPAFMTVLHNGVLTQDHVKLTGPTNWCSRSPYSVHPPKLPLALQDHGNPVRFRNIWIRELPIMPGVPVARKQLILGDKILQRYVGAYNNPYGGQVQISLVDGQLYADFPGGSADQPIYAESETHFYSAFVDAEYEFELKNDAVTGIKINITQGGWGEYSRKK